MAVLKEHTLPVFKWDKYITMNRLANIDKNFRKDAKFYVTEKDVDGLFHISLVEPKPKEGTTIHGIGWSCIERLAESKPRAIFG